MHLKTSWSCLAGVNPLIGNLCEVGGGEGARLGCGYCTLDRGHTDQIRGRVLRRLFLKSIFHEDFRNSLVSSEG